MNACRHTTPYQGADYAMAFTGGTISSIGRLLLKNNTTFWFRKIAGTRRIFETTNSFRGGVGLE